MPKAPDVPTVSSVQSLQNESPNERWTSTPSARAKTDQSRASVVRTGRIGPLFAPPTEPGSRCGSKPTGGFSIA